MMGEGLFREYGSEHHWQSRRAYETGGGRLELSGWSLYRSGRDALRALAAPLRGRRALLPALCCESMILPFKQAGLETVFYRLREDLTGDHEDLLRKAGPGDLVLYMSYFGHEPFTPSQLELFKERGLILLEDRTQDILEPREAGAFRPDATVASLRKWAALPEGGLLKTELPTAPAKTDGAFAALRRQAMEEKGLYLMGGPGELKGEFLQKLHQADELLDQDTGPIAALPESREDVLALDFQAIREARRENCAILSRCLAGPIARGEIRPLLGREDTGGLYWPLAAEDRDRLQALMAKRDIYCPAIWPTAEEAQGACENSAWVARHILALPCDQRYGKRDMEHIGAALCRCLEEMRGEDSHG